DEGFVYIAESPLYEITTKNKTYFAYTEPEKADIISRVGKEKYSIQRSKGLGENEAEMMWVTTMNPKTRRLIKVCKSDVVRTQEVFELLLGDNLSGRKQFIQDFGSDYLDQLDLS
ncbi:MAG: DNA topoisomerase, partial [Oscillospiraceae bacterium]